MDAGDIGYTFVVPFPYYRSTKTLNASMNNSGYELMINQIYNSAL